MLVTGGVKYTTVPAISNEPGEQSRGDEGCFQAYPMVSSSHCTNSYVQPQLARLTS